LHNVRIHKKSARDKDPEISMIVDMQGRLEESNRKLAEVKLLLNKAEDEIKVLLAFGSKGNNPYTKKYAPSFNGKVFNIDGVSIETVEPITIGLGVPFHGGYTTRVELSCYIGAGDDAIELHNSKLKEVMLLQL